MKILVTGSNGQLGSEIRDLAASFPGLEFVFLDRSALPMEDPAGIENLFALHQPAYFINCAAYTAVDKAEEEQELAYKINAVAVGLIAENCARNHCRLIHISTDYVFSGTGNIPFTEEDAKGPLNIYGLTKLKGEELTMENDPSAIIIRTSWVYSAHGKNFVKTMLRLMKEKESINVVSDQTGSPTYAHDLAIAILRIINSGKWIPGIYHYSNQGIISWFDFAMEIKKLSGLNCKVNPIGSAEFLTPARRPNFSGLNTSKIRETYNISIPGWKESLKACLEKLGSSPSA